MAKKEYYLDKEIAKTDGLAALVRKPSPSEYSEVTNKAEELYVKAMSHLSKNYTLSGRQLLEKSYRMGCVAAGVALSYGWSAGWFGERDYGKFLKITRYLAIRRKDAEGMCNYGWAYNFGLGVKKNIKKALFWYKKAIEGGCKIAVTELAHLYYFSFKDIKKKKEAFSLISKSNDPSAYNLLGIMYSDGIVVEKDDVKAFQMYQKSVEGEKTPNSLYNLAKCYMLGRGVERDADKANELLSEAARLGLDVEKTVKKSGFFLWDPDFFMPVTLGEIFFFA